VNEEALAHWGCCAQGKKKYIRARHVNKQKKYHYLPTVNNRHPQHLSSNKIGVYYNYYNSNKKALNFIKITTILKSTNPYMFRA
jgi:hypothetical protein